MTLPAPPATTSAGYPAWLDKLDAKRYWLFAGIAMLYLAGFNGLFQINSDACLYAEVGRNIATGKGYTYHGHHETLVYPGLPYLHALSRTLAPNHHEQLSQALLLAMAGGMLVLGYQLLRAYAIRPLAVLAFLFMATTLTVYEHAFALLTDMPFTLGTTAALLGYAWLFPPTHIAGSAADVPARPTSRSRAVLAWNLLAFGTALAIVMRPVMLALVMTLGLCAMWHLFKRNTRLRAIALLALVAALMAAFYFADPRQSADADLHYEAALVSRVSTPLDTIRYVVTTNLPHLFTYVLAEAVFAVGLDPIGSIIPTALATLFAVVGCWRRWPWILFMVISVGGMLVLSSNVPRYFLPLMPVFAIGAAITYCYTWARLPGRWGLRVSTLLILLILVPNLIKVAKAIVIQHRTPFYAHFDHGKFVPRLDAADAIKQHVKPDETVIAANYRTLTYFCQRVVVDIKRVERPKVARVISDRWRNHSQQFYLIVQKDMPNHFNPPGFTITYGPVLARSPDDETDAPWVLRSITLTPTTPLPSPPDED